MGYSVAFLGDLQFFEKGARAAWSDAAIEMTAPDIEWSAGFEPRAEDAGKSVAAILAEPSGELVDVREGPRSLTVRVIVDEDDALHAEHRGALLAAFADAGARGAAGELVIMGWEDAPPFGVRVKASKGKASFEVLDATAIAEVEKSVAYLELEKAVQKLANVAAETAPLEAWLAKKQEGETAAARTIADAPDMDAAIALLPSALPVNGTHAQHISISTLPVIDALAKRTDADATARIVAALGELLGGPLAGKADWKPHLDLVSRLVAKALVDALDRRGDREELVLTVWIEHPDLTIRDHARVAKLARKDLDARLAARLGVGGTENDDQRIALEAMFRADPAAAPARARKFLEGDPRKDQGALAAIDALVRYLFDHDDARSPAWEAWLRDVATSVADVDDRYDAYEQTRRNGIGLMANWKLEDALPLLAARFDAYGVASACDFLEELGAAAAPVLRGKLAQTKDKGARTRLERALVKIGAEGPLPPPPPKTSCFEVAPSGRAACRGCREKIAKGELRFGEAVKNVFDESGEPTLRYFHLRCAAQKRPQVFLPVLASFTGDVPDREELKRMAEEASTKTRK